MTRLRGRANWECDLCLETVALVMPVVSDAIGGRMTEHLCLGCRLAYDRAGAEYAMRAEGRHGRGHATPLLCSLQHLQWRTANVHD